MSDLAKLLAKSLDSAEMQELIAGLGESPEIFDDEDDITYSFFKSGIEVQFEKELKEVKAIHFSGGDQEYTQYKGILPQGLHFGEKKRDTRRMLGAPQLEKRAPGAIATNWLTADYYDYGAHWLGVQFDKNELVSSVALLLPPSK